LQGLEELIHQQVLHKEDMVEEEMDNLQELQETQIQVAAEEPEAKRERV
jgi:hypothetical protein